MLEIFDLENLKYPNKRFTTRIQTKIVFSLCNYARSCCAFLDEPTSGVDPITRREFWNHIYAMVQKGMTIMVTTHFMQEAEYCDEIALIYKGKAIAMATPHELILKVSPTATMQEAFIELIKEVMMLKIRRFKALICKRVIKS